MIDNEILNKIKPGAKVRVSSVGSARLSSDKKSARAGESVSSFEGIVIARKHGSEAGATFTVRSVLGGIGVEKIFPINSPNVIKVKILSSPKKIHKSKLYFIRKMPAHKIRKKIGVSI